MLLGVADLETYQGRSDIRNLQQYDSLPRRRTQFSRTTQKDDVRTRCALDLSALNVGPFEVPSAGVPPQKTSSRTPTKRARSMDEADEAEDTRPWQPGTTSRWSWYRGLGSPSRVLAPMVDQSEPQHGQGAGRPAGADLLAPQLTAPAAWDARLRALAVTRSGHSGSARGAPQPRRSQWRLTVRLQLSSCSAQLSVCHRRLFHRL